MTPTEFEQGLALLHYVASLDPLRGVIKATVEAFIEDGFTEEQARSLTVDVFHQIARQAPAPEGEDQ